MPKNSDFLSIIVPCYNEAENIMLLCERLSIVLVRNFENYEVLLIDDKSTDNTYAVMQEAKRKYSFLSLCQHQENKGIVAAWNTGLKKSQGDYIVIMDADLQYNPNDILTLYTKLKNSDVDVVQGVRCNTFETSFLRKVLSKVFALMLNCLFFNFYRDIKSGFLICKKEVFKKILQENKNYRCFQHFIGIAIFSLGYKLKQEKIDFALRNGGESFINSPVLFSLNALKDFPKAVLHFNCLRFFKLKK